MNKVLAVLGLSYFLLNIQACATALPAQEMSNARQTLKTAQDAGALTYAKDMYIRAKGFLDEAANYLNSGDFYNARLMALQATEEAKEAHLVAVNRKKYE